MEGGTMWKKLRVSYVLNKTVVDDEHSKKFATLGHSFGVNSFIFSTEKNESNHLGTLFSAGRDSTIRKWRIANNNEGNKIATQEAVLEHHIDWVNDLILTKDKKLISCSNDTTVKIWDSESGKYETSLRKHGDYVKAIAYSPQNRQLLASAGLDCTIILWDLETICAVNTISNGDSKEAKTGSPIYNIFSTLPHLDGGATIGNIQLAKKGNAILSGSTDKVVRLWDARQNQNSLARHIKFLGHTDMIRCILVNEEGTMFISGSSDQTIKLWDIGQQKCIQTLDMHEDSVWTMCTDASFTKLYSGGKDKQIFETDLKTLQSNLLFKEEDSVLKLICPENSNLWISTAKTGIENRQIGASKSDLIIPKYPGVIKHHILNNKRHVMTKDEDGNVFLWDVTQARLIGDYGKVNFEEKAKELSEVTSCANWFTPDTSTGSLVIHLEPTQCFNLDSYANDVGFTDAKEEAKCIFVLCVVIESVVNVGDSVLRGLFSVWIANRKSRFNKQEETIPSPVEEKKVEEPPEKSPPPKEEKEKTGKKEKEKDKEKEKEDKKFGKSMDKEKNEENAKVEVKEEEVKFVFKMMQDIPIIVSEINGPAIFRAKMSEFTGSESMYDKLPAWLVDCLLHNKYPTIKDSSISFFLLSEDEKKIPQLPHGSGKLNAQRIIKMKRVSNYVLSKLDLKQKSDSIKEDSIEIVCSNKALSPEMSLATVKQFIWNKSSEDFVLYYRFKH